MRVTRQEGLCRGQAGAFQRADDQFPALGRRGPDPVHQQDPARIAAAGLVDDHLPAEHRFVDAVSFSPRNARFLRGDPGRHRKEQRGDEVSAPLSRLHRVCPVHTGRV